MIGRTREIRAYVCVWPSIVYGINAPTAAAVFVQLHAAVVRIFIVIYFACTWYVVLSCRHCPLSEVPV